ncbi:hypothetical protein MKW98_017920 [Papaver atlanticum]|uniref:Uncharacterized protein n=1 Tax=Papaver atlanticum TaxID=357466 RepID=A0AAD4XTD1_9MAGN|nr:hypothetical protein MKW98_017920 [Papaver atlanticum]
MILYVLLSPALVSGLMVACAKSMAHSISFLILVFRDTSCLLLLLGLDFSVMIFLVVHIRVIIVSFIFIHGEVLRYLPVNGTIGLILWWEIFFILDNETLLLTNLETLDNLLYTYYFLWFLVPSLILLVAMIGDLVMTMERITKLKRQYVFRKNAIVPRRTIMRRTIDPLKV